VDEDVANSDKEIVQHGQTNNPNYLCNGAIIAP
jgi:hypothetical protein